MTPVQSSQEDLMIWFVFWEFWNPDTGGGDRTAGQAREQNEPEREEAL